MVSIKHYLNDGANYQAQAILTLLRGMMYEVTSIKVNDTSKVYLEVGRYENCREQGYVVALCCEYTPLVYYCFFEHRNSDDICVIKFKDNSINTPSVDTIWKDKKDKYDVDMSFGCNEVVNATEWIIDDMKCELNEYIENQKED